MKRTNGGTFAFEIALSISYCSNTCGTTALVVSDSTEHLEYLMQQVEAFSGLSQNPLLLPTLVSDHTATVIESYLAAKWDNYLATERASGQSDESQPLGVEDHYGPVTPIKFENFSDLTKKILRSIQLITSWEHYLQSSFLAIDVIEKSLTMLEKEEPHELNLNIPQTNEILRQRLSYIRYKGNATWWEMQTLKQRMQAQTTAVSGQDESYQSQTQANSLRSTTTLDSRITNSTSKSPKTANGSRGYRQTLPLPQKWIVQPCEGLHSSQCCFCQGLSLLYALAMTHLSSPMQHFAETS